VLQSECISFTIGIKTCTHRGTNISCDCPREFTVYQDYDEKPTFESILPDHWTYLANMSPALAHRKQIQKFVQNLLKRIEALEKLNQQEQTGRVPHKSPSARLGATSQSPGPRRAHTPPVSPERSGPLFPVASGPQTVDWEDDHILPAHDATSPGPTRARKVKQNVHPLLKGWTCILPIGWSTRKSESTNKYYYYNEKEGKSTNKAPSELLPGWVRTAARRAGLIRKIATAKEAASLKAGDVFYKHTDGRTQLERPIETQYYDHKGKRQSHDKYLVDIQIQK